MAGGAAAAGAQSAPGCRFSPLRRRRVRYEDAGYAILQARRVDPTPALDACAKMMAGHVKRRDVRQGEADAPLLGDRIAASR